MNNKNSGGNNQTVPHFIIWQALIWERFIIVSPILVLLIVVTLYSLGFRSWELLIDSTIGVGLLVIVVWWFWVVYTIAKIAYVIETTSGRLKDVIMDIRDIKNEVNSFEKPTKK